MAKINNNIEMAQCRNGNNETMALAIISENVS
jgi:hypothetical protein